MPKPSARVLADLELDLWMKRAKAHRLAGELPQAVALYQQVLSRKSNHPDAMREMGLAALDTGAFDVAEQILREAVKAAPKSGPALAGLARAELGTGKPLQAVASVSKAIGIAPNEASLYQLLGEAQLDADDREGARKSFRRLVKLAPGHPLGAHMLAALEDGAEGPRNAYTSALFDQYAGTFDSHLVATLGYEVPALMRKAVDALEPKRTFAAALDLGCGTGLVAESFASKVDAIDGIDIAPKMIGAARAKGIYRTLEVADIAGYLARPDNAAAYDLMLAADVFIYVGRLEAVFAAVAGALQSGGLFVFSVEDLTEGDVEIRSSGRFAHSTAYIERLAAEHGFAVRSNEPIAVRKERNLPIPGHLAVLSRS